MAAKYLTVADYFPNIAGIMEPKPLKANEIRALRAILGESQTKFGKRFAIHQTTVHLWERIGIRAGPSALAFRYVRDEVMRTLRLTLPPDS